MTMPMVPCDNGLERARALVDDRYGIVRQAVVHDIGPSDPPVFCATAEVASTLGFSDGEASRLNGGAGLEADVALMGALGEAMERYAIASYREDELVRASFREVERVAVDPSQLIFFADEQYESPEFPYVRFDPDTTLSWVRGASLFDGTERLVPAPRVYTPYRSRRPVECLMQSTSTGAACHVDRERAVTAALHECIERDAVMIAWLNRLPLPDVDVTMLDHARARGLLAWLAERDFTVAIFDATTDLAIPTAVCMLIAPENTAPSLAVGAATRSSFVAAAEKALIESAHTLFWIHTRSRQGRRVFRDDYRDVGSLDMHSLLYGEPHMRNRVAFLCGPVPERASSTKAAMRTLGRAVNAGSPSAELERCTAALRAAGCDAVIVDVTPPDVAQLGFVVVRAVVTDLHPLWGGHHLRCLGGTRVRTVPVLLGYHDEPRRGALNPDPHPMP